MAFLLHVLSVPAVGKACQIMHAGWAEGPTTVLRSVPTTKVIIHTFVRDLRNLPTRLH